MMELLPLDGHQATLQVVPRQVHCAEATRTSHAALNPFHEHVPAFEVLRIQKIYAAMLDSSGRGSHLPRWLTAAPRASATVAAETGSLLA